VLAHVGMIGGALEGDIESNLEPEGSGAREQPAEVLERAETRVDVLVAACAAADGPGAARISGRGAGSVVGTLALELADRVDRRQIKHVETHLGHVRQQPLEVGERAVLERARGRRARKHLVPAREAGALPLDLDAERRLVPYDELRVGAAARELVQRLALREQDTLLELTHGIGESVGPLVQPARLGLAQAAGVSERERRALLQLDLDVLTRLMLLRQRPPPALEVIDPCLDREEVAAEPLDGDSSPPAIVAEKAHRHPMPVALALVPVQHRGGHRVVSVRENVGFDDHALAEHPPRGEPAAVHLRSDAFDDDARLGHQAHRRAVSPVSG
jgi:hypothetical protein